MSNAINTFDTLVTMVRLQNGNLHEDVNKLLAMAEEARAAIAELIEASKFALDKSWEYGADEPHFVKLNVAIARCNGGAA